MGEIQKPIFLIMWCRTIKRFLGQFFLRKYQKPLEVVFPPGDFCPADGFRLDGSLSVYFMPDDLCYGDIEFVLDAPRAKQLAEGILGVINEHGGENNGQLA